VEDELSSRDRRTSSLSLCEISVSCLFYIYIYTTFNDLVFYYGILISQITTTSAKHEFISGSPKPSALNTICNKYYMVPAYIYATKY
jgi:hypothetical protein